MSGYPYIDDLARQARDRPEAAALVLPDREVTWQALDQAANDHARKCSGTRASDGGDPAFGLPLVPGEEAVVALHALPRIGRYLVPLDARHPLDSAGAHLDHPDLTESGPNVVWVEPRPDSIRTGMLTSGSSGEPRQVPLTFANHRAASEAARQLFELTPEDRWLACLPFHHIGGLSVFTRSAHVGFPAVLSWPFDAAAVTDAVERHRATAISLVPTMLRRLLDADWKPPASLRFALLGGAACPPGLQREALDRGVPIAPTFGMTETCSQICTLLPREVDAHLGTVGRSIPGATLKIRDADDGSLPNGQVGRIWVMGPMVARSPEMENSLDGEGGPWLKTSDLGSLDNDGFLTVVGRADDMILTGGENVAPSEIEQLLVLRNDVAEAAVVGIGDPEWGERIVAAVVPGAGRSPDAEVLSAYLSDHLDAFKVPKSIAILDELPLIGPGKVDRDMLQQLLSVNPAGAGDR